MKNNALILEITEHIENINNIVNNIDDNLNDINTINEFFRSIHTIKGNSLSGGYSNLSRVAHKLEEILDKLRTNRVQPNKNITDLILETVDAILSIFDYIKDNNNDNYPVDEILDKIDIVLQPFINSLETITFESFNLNVNDLKNNDIKENDKLYKANITISEKVFIPPIYMFQIYNSLSSETSIIKTFPTLADLSNEDIPDDQFTENFFVIIKLNNEDPDNYFNSLKSKWDDITDIKYETIELKNIFEKQKLISEKNKIQTDNFVRVSINQLNHLLSILQNFVIIKNRFENRLKNTDDYILKDLLSQLRLNTNSLNHSVMNIRLLEMNQVLSRFPSLVRKLCRKLNKKVKLIIEGENTKIDRAILDVIGDPLVHIIRNCLDHGIEMPEERVKSGKNEEGTINIKINKIDNLLQIIIEDDGGGVNIEKVKSKAIEKNIITETDAETLSEPQIVDLIMKPGFSTADNVSDVSGRGVGMDVVKDTIVKLRGSITVKSKYRQGTYIIINLPSSISITSCIYCKVDNHKFLLPVHSVYEIIEVSVKDLINENKNYYIDLSNKNILNKDFNKKIPVVFLLNYFPDSDFYVLLLKDNENHILSLAVEKILNQYDLIIQPLNMFFFRKTKLFNGTALLGNNSPALTINTHYIFKNLISK